MSGNQDTAGLVALIDRLESLLNSSELSEIEIEAGDTALVLRKPVATAPGGSSAAASGGSAAPPSVTSVLSSAPAAEVPHSPTVIAPLTGLFYLSPSPDAEPYVREGSQVVVGQVIGLIDAMKLFNEIKSDLSGRVTKIWVESGALVKAKQPLIEVEP